MIVSLVRYKVRADDVAEARKAVARFVEAVARNEPQTVYRAYLSEDGVSFVHWMQFADEDAEHRHQQADYTAELFATLGPLCEERPVATGLDLIQGAG